MALLIKKELTSAQRSQIIRAGRRAKQQVREKIGGDRLSLHPRKRIYSRGSEAGFTSVASIYKNIMDTFYPKKKVITLSEIYKLHPDEKVEAESLLLEIFNADLKGVKIDELQIHCDDHAEGDYEDLVYSVAINYSID